MSEQLQGQFIPEETRTKKGEVVRPDNGLCCLCREPREEGFRYLCAECSAESVSKSLEIAAAIVRSERMRRLA